MPTILRTPAGRFRVVAIAEAISWAGLLAGMFLEHVAPGDDAGVAFFGPVHGALFTLYVAVALLTWSSLRWSPRVAATAVLAGVPPFATWFFERWATRSGRLQPST